LECGGLFGVFRLDKILQIRQAGAPESAVLLQPGIDRFKWIRIELVKTVTPFTTLLDQMSAAQQPQVFRNCRSRSSTARRVGSAKALKVASGEYVTER
jgi:hypothetical protein